MIPMSRIARNFILYGWILNLKYTKMVLVILVSNFDNADAMAAPVNKDYIGYNDKGDLKNHYDGTHIIIPRIINNTYIDSDCHIEKICKAYK